MNTTTQTSPASFFYDPPYARPLEDELAWHLVKYLNDLIGFDYQVKVRTPAGAQHIDFVLTAANALRVGLEVSELDDEIEYAWRDALVIGSSALDVLYRFRAADLLYRPHDVLYLASQWDPALFTTCGQTNLHALASPETRLLNPQPYQTKITMNYPGAEPDGEQAPGLTSISVKRLARTNPDAWMRLYEQALAHYSTPPSSK